MTTDKSIVKNPATVEKEALLKDLQKERAQLLKKLEKQKVKLEILKEDIISTQQRNFSDFTSRMDAIKLLQAELKELFTKISKMKGISREEKRMMKEMAKEMSGNLFEDFDDVAAEAQQGNSQKKPPSDFFTQFAPKPDAKETQEIRKVFLRLATRFHPDKARNQAEQERLHKLMQRINEAYSRGDIAALIEIENKYAALNTVPDENEAGLADFLQKQIDTLSKELDLLHNQLDRVTAELNNINRSEVGKIYKQSKRKYNPAGQMTAGLDQTIDQLTLLRDGLKEYLETGIIPPSLQAELEPDEPIFIDMDDLIEAFLEMEEEEIKKKTKSRRRR
jgi:hypothetical protein